jgi:dedicator of cytokinesis protein 3
LSKLYLICDDLTNEIIFQLWSNYFDLAVSFLTQPSLQLEKRTASQRLKMVRAQGGDMRVQMGFQILVEF